MGSLAKHRTALVITFSLAAVLAFSGCGIFRESGGGRLSTPTVAVRPGDDPAIRLREAVDAFLREVSSPDSESRAALKREAPYYYREYVVYPDIKDYEVTLRETDSLTAPFLGEARLTKMRYATQLYRDRDDALTDNNFIRGSGTETISFQLKNGRWMNVGSLFLADRLEQQVNGEWVAVREEDEEALISEEGKQGFLGSMWSTITGR